MLADVLRRGSVDAGVRFFTDHFIKQTSTGNQDVTIPAEVVTAMNAAPYAIIVETAGSDDLTSVWSSRYALSFGLIAKNSAAALTQFSVASTSEDAASTSDAGRAMNANCISLVDNGGGSLQAAATFVGTQGSTAMRFNWGTNASGPTFGATVIIYTIITGLEDANVLNWTLGGSVGERSVTGAGFRSDHVIHAVGGSTAALPQIGTWAQFGIGWMNKHGQQGSNACTAQDGQNPSNVSRYQRPDACIVAIGASEAVNVVTHFFSMESDGFKVHNTTINDRQMISLCLKGVSSKIGAFTHPTTAINKTVDSRHGFIPKGIINTGVRDIPYASAVTNGFWHFGMSDIVNQRAVALADLDAESPTKADAVWMNDAIIAEGVVGPTPSTSAKASLSSVGLESFVTNFSTADGTEFEELYNLFGDPGVDTFPAITLDTATTNAAPTAYSNQKKVAVLSTGRTVRVVAENTTNARFEWSDDGQTWTDYGADIAGGINLSIDSYVDSGGTERLVAVWRQSGTGGGRTDGYTYVMVGTFNAGRTTLTWGTASSLSAGATYFNYPDVVAHPEGTGGAIHVVATYFTSAVGNNGTRYSQITSTSATPTVLTVVQDLATTTGGGGNYGQQDFPTCPSIDIDPVTKRLFWSCSAGVTGSGKGIRFRTASYSGGTWTWASEVEVDTTYYISSVNDTYVVTRWDATNSEVVIGGQLLSSVYDLVSWSSSAFTAGTFTKDTQQAGGSSTEIQRFYAGSMALDVLGNRHFFGWGYGGGYQQLNYRKYTRATDTTGSLVVLDSTFGMWASAFLIEGGIGWIYTRGASAPYAIAYDQLLTS